MPPGTPDVSGWKDPLAGRKRQRRLSAAGTGGADVRIEATVLRAEPDPAVGIIMTAEHQAVRPALLVVHIGKSGGVAQRDAGGRGGGGRARGGCWVGRNRIRADARGRAAGASQTAAAVIATRAIDRTGTSAQRRHAQTQASQHYRRFQQSLQGQAAGRNVFNRRRRGPVARIVVVQSAGWSLSRSRHAGPAADTRPSFEPDKMPRQPVPMALSVVPIRQPCCRTFDWQSRAIG